MMMSLGLVNYSSSSEDEEAIEPEHVSGVQQPKQIKLPNPFQKDEKIAEETSAEHQGRLRTFEHERGIWASYVYIPGPRTEMIQTLQSKLIGLIKANIKNDDKSLEINPIDDFHMSLTRTSVLRHHWIDEFIRSVQNSLNNVQRFWIPLNSIRIYCNDNKTRTFISLALNEMDSSAQRSLCDIVKRLDDCLKDFNLPPFYKKASFHVSLVWCLGDQKTLLESLLPQFRSLLELLLATEPSEFCLNVDLLNAKIGNKLFNFQIKR